MSPRRTERTSLPAEQLLPFGGNSVAPTAMRAPSFDMMFATVMRIVVHLLLSFMLPDRSSTKYTLGGSPRSGTSVQLHTPSLGPYAQFGGLPVSRLKSLASRPRVSMTLSPSEAGWPLPHAANTVAPRKAALGKTNRFTIGDDSRGKLLAPLAVDSP